LFETAIQEK